MNCISSACRFSAFNGQTSHSFIGFITSVPRLRRQVESSC
jgi:hypothetical protein